MLSLVEKRDVPEDASRRPGLIWRTMASIIMLLGWLLFATVWTFFLAGDLGYNEYQSWSVCLATVLVMAALAGAMWVPWGMRHPASEWDEKKRSIEDEISERVKKEVAAALERELGKGR